MANVVIEVLYGYRGVPTKNVYMKPGKHGVDAELAKYLVENGHAVYVDEPKTEAEPTDETPKRKTRRKKSSDNE